MSVLPRPTRLTWPQIEHDWRLFSGQLRATWEKLTGADIETIDGRRDHLAEKISERYSVSREEAEAQVEEWVTHLHDRITASEVKTTRMKAVRV